MVEDVETCRKVEVWRGSRPRAAAGDELCHCPRICEAVLAEQVVGGPRDLDELGARDPVAYLEQVVRAQDASGLGARGDEDRQSGGGDLAAEIPVARGAEQLGWHTWLDPVGERPPPESGEKDLVGEEWEQVCPKNLKLLLESQNPRP